MQSQQVEKIRCVCVCVMYMDVRVCMLCGEMRNDKMQSEQVEKIRCLCISVRVCVCACMYALERDEEG